MIRLPYHLDTDRIGRVLVVSVTLATAGTTVFLGVLTMRDPHTLVTGDAVRTARQAGLLLAARNVPLTAALLLLLALRAWRPLGCFLALAGVEQVFDSVVFACQHKVVQSVGPAVFAVALVASAWWLLRRDWRSARNATLRP